MCHWKNMIGHRNGVLMWKIAYYKNINGRCPLEISEGHTQDISKFWFNSWEPIWYFKNCKAPENLWQPARCTGFSHSNRDEMWYYIKIEEKNPKYLIISVIRTILGNIGTYKEYTNEDPNQVPELTEMELVFLKSSNEIISGDLEKFRLIRTKFQGR